MDRFNVDDVNLFYKGAVHDSFVGVNAESIVLLVLIVNLMNGKHE